MDQRFCPNWGKDTSFPVLSQPFDHSDNFLRLGIQHVSNFSTLIGQKSIVNLSQNKSNNL